MEQKDLVPILGQTGEAKASEDAPPPPKPQRVEPPEQEERIDRGGGNWQFNFGFLPLGGLGFGFAFGGGGLRIGNNRNSLCNILATVLPMLLLVIVSLFMRQ
jgi:hypothetical protein